MHVHGKHKPPATQEEGNGLSAHHWAGLCQPRNYIFAPTCSTFTSALPAFSEASPWQPQVTHLELILNRPGGIVRSHAGAQTSVWRWFCNKASPLTRTQRWAKSSPQAEFCEVFIWHWSTALWHWLSIEIMSADSFYLTYLLSLLI